MTNWEKEEDGLFPDMSHELDKGVSVRQSSKIWSKI